MYWTSFVFLILSGALLCYQDLKTRLLSVWLIIVFSLSNILFYLSSNSYQQLIENAVFCACYLLFSYAVLLLYFYIKTRRFEKIIGRSLGLGDVLVFMAIGTCLEADRMIFFFTGAMIISLIAGLCMPHKHKAIPLAGLVVLNYMAYIISSLYWNF